MGVLKRGDDAADHAPRPKDEAANKDPHGSPKQDAPNYEERTDGGRAIEREDVNSANDE